MTEENLERAREDGEINRAPGESDAELLHRFERDALPLLDQLYGCLLYTSELPTKA